VNTSGVSRPATMLLAASQSNHFYSTVFYGKELIANTIQSRCRKQNNDEKVKIFSFLEHDIM